jgi:cholesterol oxidase
MCEHFDAIVVGSGFGGSVMAYRLAKEGMRVCLLERGKKYPPGKFARTPHEMSKNFWDPSEGLHGLFNIWSFRGLDAIVASGLGGGSLIYANVLLRKDKDWFVQDNTGDPEAEDWPITYDQLERHYAAVEQILKPQVYPFKSEPYKTTPKTIEFRKAADALKLDLIETPLGVIFQNPCRDPALGEPIMRDQYNLHGHTHQRRTCNLCGECVIGCNSGSKNTLDHTYLSQAEWYGAQIRIRCEAREIAPRGNSKYLVRYVEHLEEHEGHRLDTSDTSQLPLKEMSADQLVLAAGAIGSTFLMLRNKQHFPNVSHRLGTRLSGNGDLLGFAVKHNVSGPQSDSFHASRGPVITSSIRISNQADTDDRPHASTQRGFYIQDAGYPNIANWLLHVLDLPGAIWVARRPLWKFIRKHLLRRPDLDAGAEIAALFGHNKRSAGMMPLLGMGRDIPNGVLEIKGNHVDLTFNWKHRMRKTSANYAYFKNVSATMERIAGQMRARFTRSIHLYFRRAVTVHPLGGCPMGRTIGQGVVDSQGEVFNYPGLFIADGSVMPGPVGPNPSLTIAALADRFADKVICNYHAKRTSPQSIR